MERPTLRESVIRAAHCCDDVEVQAAAIALFWYWVYRLNGKILRLSSNGN